MIARTAVAVDSAIRQSFFFIKRPTPTGRAGADYGFVAANVKNVSGNAGSASVCLGFSTNTIDQAGTGAGGDVRFRQRFDSHVALPGYTGPQDGVTGTPTVASYIQGLNPTGPPSVTSISSTAGGGGFFNTTSPTTGAACPVPAF